MNLGMFVMITVIGDGSVGLLMEDDQVIAFDYDEARKKLDELQPYFPIRHGFPIGWELKGMIQDLGKDLVDCCYFVSRQTALTLGAISHSEQIVMVNAPLSMQN